MTYSMEMRPRNRWALIERVDGKRPRTVKTFASMAECERALNEAAWATKPVTPSIHDPRNHDANCDFQVDQYVWECTCGASTGEAA
jgi:hypothetical protein